VFIQAKSWKVAEKLENAGIRPFHLIQLKGNCDSSGVPVKY